ncbi:hypothetical protein H9Q69_014387, partial [Fusarium xylarioides]
SKEKKEKKVAVSGHQASRLADRFSIDYRELNDPDKVMNQRKISLLRRDDLQLSREDDQDKARRTHSR